MKILVAVRESERHEIISILRKMALPFYPLTTLSNIAEIASDVQLTLIDEDFDGLQTGWKLARSIKQTGHSIKIVMIVRRNPEHNLISLYDVTMGFPISEEQLVGEINR